MICTPVFDANLQAYNAGARIIANKGGSRSSKTFSIQQLEFLIQRYSQKERIITCVSHSFGHLESGAIRDWENILTTEGIDVEAIRTKNPYRYRVGHSLFEFIGFDKPGKALGAARDILHINEPNLMPFNICHQLIQRTKETIFLDWNPAAEFWFDTEKFAERNDCKVITSTFLDNYNPITGKTNLTDGQIQEFEIAYQKALAEDRKGKRGYWWNYWQVYGLGKLGQLEGVIFNNWQDWTGELPEGDYYTLFVIDWGGNDPNAICELKFGNNNTLYVKEHVYSAQILNSKLIKTLTQLAGNKEIICDSARKDKIYELAMAGLAAFGATKGEGSIIDGIDLMQEFNIFVKGENVQDEFKKYRWAVDKITGKPLNEPEDKNNHAIDAIRYGVRWYRRNIKPN